MELPLAKEDTPHQPQVPWSKGSGASIFPKLVVGPWGELSKDFHILLRTFAEKRVEGIARSKGKTEEGGELGKAMGDIRRAFSVEIVRSQSLCLLERLAFLSPGAKAANERRKMAEALFEKRRRQIQAYNLAHRERGLSRIGQAFVL